MGHTIIVLILAALIGCEKSEDKFPDEIPSDEVKSEYRALSQNIVDNFTIGGFGVISRKPNGEPEHQGEALIWGGTYLWAAPCDISEPVSKSMAAMVDRLDGQLIRVDPLGEYIGGREVTLDGAIGFMLGVSRRITDCNEWQLWEQPIRKMIDFQNANNDRLHRNVQAKMTRGFTYLRDLIASKITASPKPSEDRKRDLEKVLAGWPALVQAARTTGVGSSACFRVNLSFSSVLTLETLGKDFSQEARNQFCHNTKEMDIPTISHYCGRKSILEYIASYMPDQWEYRHQRCQWESPDGKENTSPKLDLLMAYVLAYGWHSLQN